MLSRFNAVTKTYKIEVQDPPASITYDNYRKCDLDSEELKEMGFYAEDYSTHSFRLGGLSVMVSSGLPSFHSEKYQVQKIELQSGLYQAIPPTRLVSQWPTLW